MDWKIIASVFAAVFLAELGDKTQLATFGFSAGNENRLSVFIGSAAALVSASAIGVLFGGLVGKYVSLIWVERISGALFILIGIWTIYKTFLKN